LRLSGQLSFREYDDDFGNTGDISVVTINLQFQTELKDIYDRYEAAINLVLSRIQHTEEA
jgi:hypothetical protein